MYIKHIDFGPGDLAPCPFLQRNRVHLSLGQILMLFTVFSFSVQFLLLHTKISDSSNFYPILQNGTLPRGKTPDPHLPLVAHPCQYRMFVVRASQ